MSSIEDIVYATKAKNPVSPKNHGYSLRLTQKPGFYDNISFPPTASVKTRFL